MKKCLTVLAFALSVGCVNAATITWGLSQQVTPPTGTAWTTPYTDNITAQLIFVPSTYSVADVINGVFLPEAASGGAYQFGPSVGTGTMVGTAGTLQINPANYTYTYGETVVGPGTDTIQLGTQFFIRMWTTRSVEVEAGKFEDVDFYMDIFGDGAVWNATKFITIVDNGENPNYINQLGVTGSWGGTWDPLTNPNNGWKVVPEPATMALLGIGVVAVGLRRRRK